MAVESGSRGLDERLMRYGAGIIRFSVTLPKELSAKLKDQLVSSSTSVGANYQEAQGAESKADFTHKLQVSLKEMRESYYWLRVFHLSGLVKNKEMDHLLDESRQLRAILSKSVATAKGKNKD